MALRRGPSWGTGRAGRAAEVAWEAALSIVLGALIGIFVDSKTGTSPIFLMIFMALGLTVAVRTLLRFAKAQTKADAEAKARSEEPPDRESQ